MDSRYRDTGCDRAPSCLNCPFLRCRYDGPVALQSARRADRRFKRNAEMVRLRREGLKVTELMAYFDLSKSSVHRILAAGIEAEVDG